MTQLTIYYLLPHPSKLLKQVKLVPVQEQGELSLLKLCRKENGRERTPLQLGVQIYHQVIQLLHPQHLPILQVDLRLLQLDLPLLHQLKLQLAILIY